MKKILLVILVCVIAFTGCVKKNKTNETFNDVVGTHEEIDDNLNNNAESEKNLTEHNENVNSINLKKYRGIWGAEDTINVFYIDDNTLDIQYNLFRNESFYFRSIKFDKNGVGKCNYNRKWTGGDGKQYSQEVEGQVYLKDSEITIKIDKYNTYHDYKEDTFYIDEKFHVTTKEEINKIIDQAISSGGQNIDKNVLNIVKNGKDYITLGINASYVETFSNGEKQYVRDWKMYNIDKKSNKAITIYDFLNNDEKKISNVKKYIEQEILRKTNEYIRTHGDIDLEPHWRFNEVDFEEKFVINEENKTLDIECSYPDEARRAYGILKVQVPFDVIDSLDIKVTKEDIFLYRGLEIKPQVGNYDSLDISYDYMHEQSSQKYNVMYYNYENGKYVGTTTGEFDNEGPASVENVSTFAFSKQYNVFPRTYSMLEELPGQLIDMADYTNVDIMEIDLDGDNTKEYIACGQVDYSKYDTNTVEASSNIMLFNSKFEKISDIVTLKDDFVDGYKKYLSFENVTCIDVDNDGIMEILMDIPGWEWFTVKIVKYDKGQFYEGSNVKEFSIAP